MTHSMQSTASRSRTRRALFPALPVLALTCGGHSAGTAGAADAGVTIKVYVSGFASVGSTSFTVTAHGKSSHLGNVAYYGSGQFTSPTSDVLTETLTAADGDTLTILCVQTLEDLGGGLLHGSDNWTVIGGTGRFAGATGTGTGDTYVQSLSSFTKSMTGTILYK